MLNLEYAQGNTKLHRKDITVISGHFNRTDFLHL